MDADKVVLTGGITVHLMAGFGGGRKSIMPGVSGYVTVQKTILLHWLMKLALEPVLIVLAQN
jgi:nickel-dependent lactate racemase